MKTMLYDQHCVLGAKMASFAGWEMPIHYKGILAEHRAVREKVGLFDVSHMGRISVRGRDAEKLLDLLATNRIEGKEPLSATYTVWCNPEGGSLDDVITYKIRDEEFFVIVNAGNRQKDLEHLKKQAKGLNVEIQDHYLDGGILALQGPQALPLLLLLYPEIAAIKPMHFIVKDDLVISRTGYTGAGGFEIYGNKKQIRRLWDELLEKGQPFGIEPAGLGARDTLRLEMGFALYGHELTETIAPSESVSAWTIKWDKPDFMGKQALEKLEISGSKRNSYGIRLIDKGIARQGYPVFYNQKPIGTVTSGSFSPTLNAAIGLILVDKSLKSGDIVEVEIRGSKSQAEVVQLPFIKKEK
jgi:aminomethyltransferase